MVPASPKKPTQKRTTSAAVNLRGMRYNQSNRRRTLCFSGLTIQLKNKSHSPASPLRALVGLWTHWAGSPNESAPHRGSGWVPQHITELNSLRQSSKRLSAQNYSAFRRRFISVYAVSISFIRAVASTSRSGLSFTWRMNLPVPSNRRSGSAISAPRKNPTLT